MRILLLGSSLLFASASLAQAPDNLQAELTKLAADAQSLQRDLPSVTCKETASSQAIKKGNIKWQVQFRADVTAKRLASGRLDEHLQFTELNGAPFSGTNFKLPILVDGGFDEALLYFLPDAQPCLKFTLTTGRLDFEPASGSLDKPACKFIAAPRGFALLDAAGNITHIERKSPPKLAHRINLVASSSYDLVPTKLGEKLYPLSTRTIVEDGDRGDTVRFQADYADCKLFKTTVTVLSGSQLVPDNSEDHPSPKP